MKICIVGSLGPERTPDPLNRLVGYTQVMAYFMAREFERMGHEVDLFHWRNLGQSMPESDACLVLSGWGIRRILNEPTMHKIVSHFTKRLIRMSDGEERSVFDWGKSRKTGAYFGLGADPHHCYPCRKVGEDPVILFNPWKHPPSTESLECQWLHEESLEALREMQRLGCKVWTISAKIGFEDRVLGTESPPGKEFPDGFLRYVPWVDICAAMREGFVFFDTTPKVVELGRTEAACCGNILLVPEKKQSRQRDIEGVDYLNQREFSPGGVMQSLAEAVDASCDQDFESDVRRAREYFNWPLVAKRIIGFLEK
jgi:hypothetical protein